MRLKLKPQRLGDIAESVKRGFIRVVWSQGIEDTEMAERQAREKEKSRVAEVDRISAILGEIATFNLDFEPPEIL